MTTDQIIFIIMGFHIHTNNNTCINDGVDKQIIVMK